MIKKKFINQELGIESYYINNILFFKSILYSYMI